MPDCSIEEDRFNVGSAGRNSPGVSKKPGEVIGEVGKPWSGFKCKRIVILYRGVGRRDGKRMGDSEGGTLNVIKNMHFKI